VADVGLDPTHLADSTRHDRPAYNAGLLGATLRMVDFWSAYEVEHALHPDIAVIGVSSRDLNSNAAGYEAQDDAFLGTPVVRELLGNESVLERANRRLGDFSALWRHRVALRRPLESLAGYDPPQRTKTVLNEQGMDLHLAGERYRLDGVVRRFFQQQTLHDFRVSRRQLDGLTSLVMRLKRAGTKVLILDVPTTADYIALHPHGAHDYADYQRALRTLAANAGVALIDPGVWPTHDFADPLHLNRSGADRLTDLVAERLGR